MNKKNIATTIILLLCSIWFATTGSTFMNLLYEKNKIEVENPYIKTSSGVVVCAADDEENKPLDRLIFSDISLGLKPVTGSPNKETGIPTTVTDARGTEGLYSAIKITAPANLKIVVANIEVLSNNKDVNIERKNLWIALKNVKNSAQTLENDSIELIKLQNAQENAEFTILFWIDSNADEILKGSKIKFEMHFIV